VLGDRLVLGGTQRQQPIARAGQVRPLDEQTCLFETGAQSVNDLVGFLTSLEVPFEVLDPPDLRDRLRELAARYAAAAGP